MTLAEQLIQLATAYGDALTCLARLNAEYAADPTAAVRMSYSVGGQQRDYNAYRASLLSVIDRYDERVRAAITAAQLIAGPYTEYSVVRG